MESLRTFIACELPADVRAALGAIQRSTQKQTPDSMRCVKWVNPDGIHLTLKFLGATPADSVDAIVQAMQEAANSARPLALQLSRPGAFPNAHRPRVLWVGIEGDVAPLQRLQAAIEATVAPLGFPSENRPFSPHLTLGRLRDDAAPDDRCDIAAAVTALRPEPVPFMVSSISLMRSDLLRDGAVYTRLAEIRLG